MEFPSTRMQKIIDILDIRPADLARDMGYSQSYISDLTIKGGNPREHFYKLLNLIYNIDETWAKTGEGKMFVDDSEARTRLVLRKIKRLTKRDQKVILDTIDALSRRE